MSGDIVQMDASTHKTVSELLPWYVNNTLADDEIALVDQHLQNCPRCRADLEWQRNMLAADAGMTVTGDADKAWARMRARLDAPQRQHKRFDWLWQWWQASPRWSRWAMAVQLAAIIGLTATLLLPAPPPQYRLLGAADAAQGNLVVVFRPETSERQLRLLLRAHQARLVDGPTLTDAYVLQVPRARHGAILQALRGEPAVVLAESLAAGGEKP